jgi:hypothetical protein
MAVDYDPGPGRDWEQLFQSAPLNYCENYPSKPFHTRFGPVFYRGRLDGTARVLVVGQDPSTDEVLAHRILIGQAGQLAQNFLSKLGLTRDSERCSNECDRNRSDDNGVSQSALRLCQADQQHYGSPSLWSLCVSERHELARQQQPESHKALPSNISERCCSELEQSVSRCKQPDTARRRRPY